MQLKHTNQKMANLLLQERECFRSILSESQKVLDCSSNITTESIYDLLFFREQKIAEYTELEVHLSGTYDGDAYSYVNIEMIRNEIADIAKILVGIDAKIIDTLHTLKGKCVQELVNIKQRQQSVAAIANNSGTNSRVINILQE